MPTYISTAPSFDGVLSGVTQAQGGVQLIEFGMNALIVAHQNPAVAKASTLSFRRL